MPYCIGVDEAGYGPRLGPLVISASVWELSDWLQAEQMYHCLSGLIVSKPFPSRKPGRSPADDSSHPNEIPQEVPPLLLADSKIVYSRQGRSGLERTVLTMLAVAGHQPTDWTKLLQIIALDPESRHSALAWYPDYWPRIPESISTAEIAALAECLLNAMATQGIRFLGLRTVLVFPERFNRLIGQYGNKATMLSCQTLEMVKGLLAELPPGPVLVLCDKHGGRDRYEHLLSETFAPHFLQPAQVKPIQQARQESIYHVQTADRGAVEFRFLCGGESLMPIALASMLSKYLRELAMEAWNRFWADQLPGIRPTAGYPQDADRFRTEIAHRQAALGIPDSAIWRNR